MADIDIERGWTIWPTDEPANDEHPHHRLAVRVTELGGAVLLEIEEDDEDAPHAAHAAALLNAAEWRELTSLPVRLSDPDEIASDQP